MMLRFVASFTLRLDSKGRVSIPGPFRSVLRPPDETGSKHDYPGTVIVRAAGYR